jgi:hypothetical protein
MKTGKLAAALLMLCAAIAWDEAKAGNAAACCDFVSNCSQMTDFMIETDAYLDGSGAPTKFGMCYFHSRETCPDCACPFYVKVSHYKDQKGFDGGTGCLQTKADVIRVLRQLCEDGVCCCPNPVPNGVCSSNQKVWARDPLTKSCCEFANPCVVPAGWPQFTSEIECL